MDQEIASLKLNINQLAGITGVHRQTVAARLKNVDPAPGSNAKLKLFSVTDVLTELMIPTVSGDVAEMTPSDRLAHWKTPPRLSTSHLTPPVIYRELITFHALA